MMRIQKYASGYAIFMGVSMIGMWITFFLSDQIPELATRPLEIMMHLLAEFTTAVLLVIGGLAFWCQKPGGYALFLVAMGMLMYTVIMSPGYFLQHGQPGFVAMFGVFLLLAVTLTVMSIYKNTNYQ